jgi:hypothetical protein
MPLNKLENFIKNTEGRILYVNPNDLDSTDSIENQGNSLTKPFKTIQRAILESARFSYLRGSNNDITEKTTILLFPGEHLLDNRPGYAIKDIGGVAKAVPPSGTPETNALDEFSLDVNSNFDIVQRNNDLYKFNSIYGGVIVPRGTSIVGLDLRKTKIRPKYIPNPTDPNVKSSAMFRITGACYFWQFSVFDGLESDLVYTDPVDFSENNQTSPTFSHHKLTVFEYADGVNLPIDISTDFALTDLDMYYAKLSNAFNAASGRNIDQKYPESPDGFAKQRPEWEIVGAFAPDPINISNIISGDGATPSNLVTVTTASPHGFNEGTPIKIRGVNVEDYNISTKVATVSSTDPNVFTYLLPFVRPNLPAGNAGGLSASGSTVTIETDTVSGASPYIFNVSMRSIWGLNGMHADGSKASGFRSMVVAQFTGVSLQKDDRAFVKYNPKSRSYDNIGITKQTGADLAASSSSTNVNTVYHLDSDAIYRRGWQPSHIKITNDAFIQVVSVFAIGYSKHFDARSGGDGSITNSNSNFGQLSLYADGFKKESFDKDDKAFVTSIITPRAIVAEEKDVDWISFDVDKTSSVGVSSHLYLFGFNSIDDVPPIVTQGYRVGAKVNDVIYINTTSAGTKSSKIFMTNNVVGAGSTIAFGTITSEKTYIVTNISTSGSSVITIGSHNLNTGEKIRIISEVGDLPESVVSNTVYYAITNSTDPTLTSTQIRIASSKTNADNGSYIILYGGLQLKVVSRVSDKNSGDIGSPVQWDSVNSAWFLHGEQNNDIYTTIKSLGVAGLGDRTNVSYIKRIEDTRSLDERLYKLRVVVPRELDNARDPIDGFVIQESSSTNARNNLDFTLTSIGSSDYLYNRNPRFISTCTVSSGTVTVITELPHNLKVDDIVIIKNVTSTDNPSATVNRGYNGTFEVTNIVNDKTFQYSTVDTIGVQHSPGTCTNNVNSRTTLLPLFEKNDVRGNFYIYRNELISPYIKNVQDGIYHLYILNASNQIETEFTDLSYSQAIVDLYPQLDRDNINDNPPAAKTYAKRDPIGEVVTNELKRSITKETVDKVYTYFDIAPTITSLTSTPTSSTLAFNREHRLAGIVTYSSLTGGSGFVNGTYYNVKLFNTNGNPTTAPWFGATANVVVSGGSVTNAEIVSSGSGYDPTITGSPVGTLYFDRNALGGAISNASVTFATSGISTAVGNYVHVTGIGTATDGYYRITSTPSASQISIAVTTGDTLPSVGQYVIDNGPSIFITGSSTVSDVTTFTCAPAHGLLIGNQFRLVDASNNFLGDFIVKERVSVTQFTAETGSLAATPKYAFKHVLSSNNASSDSSGENLGIRGVQIYGGETAILSASITVDTSFPILVPNAGISTTKRFPLGSYIQIDEEIMRVVSSTLSGGTNDYITVVRGVFGTIRKDHSSGSLIKKIKPLPIEFRRPSILRASGHTFEYLGYGPGNYSTGLPQIQNKTLSEREDFLAQSQETAAGSVIYTGMNSNGDFFIGNTKYSASSGEQKTFDIPTATVTGEDASRLSVVYDEVIAKERLIVEGGNSGKVLSQFNGPVGFAKEVTANSTVTINNLLKVNSSVQITGETQSTTKDAGALIIDGGVGIEKNVSIGGLLTVSGVATITSATQATTKDEGCLVVDGGIGVEKNIVAGGLLRVVGVTTIANTTQSSSTTTGALVVSGGAGIGGNLYVGGGTTIAGGIAINGSTTIRNIRVGAANSNTIDTTYGILNLEAGINGGQVNINENTYITGILTVTDDIVAFASDERLKENIKPIENALEKVLTLNGFTYNFNEIGESLGFNRTITHVGVSAQQIQNVLPEAVVPAPVDSNYLTVKYDKIIPLLIEAIKELKAEIDELKRR